MRTKALLAVFETILVTSMLLPCTALAYTLTGLKWRGTSTTYDYSALGSTWRTEVASGASDWNQAGAQFSFAYSSGSSNDWRTADLGWPGPLATTSVTYSGSTITRCRVQFNTNASVSWSTTGEADKYDVQSIATHEFGHWLCLGHSTVTFASMYAYFSLGEVRAVSADDVSGICAIYSD